MLLPEKKTLIVLLRKKRQNRYYTYVVPYDTFLTRATTSGRATSGATSHEVCRVTCRGGPPVLWRKAAVAWDASAPLHETTQVRHDAGGRPLLSAGAVRPLQWTYVLRGFVVTSGRYARNTAVSTEAHSLQLFYRAGSTALQAHRRTESPFSSSA